MYVRGLWGRGVSRLISSPGVATTPRADHGSFAFTSRTFIYCRTENLLLVVALVVEVKVQQLLLQLTLGINYIGSSVVVE